MYLLDETADKHLPRYKGPYRIERLRDNIALLVHHYTGKQLKSYVHISKLKAQNSVARDLLTRRYTAAAAPATQSVSGHGTSNVTQREPAASTSSAAPPIATISGPLSASENVNEKASSFPVQSLRKLRNEWLQSLVFICLVATLVSQVLRV